MIDHRMLVSVDMVVEIDPDRVEEWVEANFDTDEESVEIADLSRGNGASAPIVYDGGPGRQSLAVEQMRQLSESGGDENDA